MNLYAEDNNDDLSQTIDSDGENTMAVLSQLGGGGDDVLPEGEPLGMDENAGKAKVSGSSLAVGAVVVLGAASLFGMKMTLGAIGVDTDPASAIAEIDGFIATHNAAPQGDTTAVDAADQESEQVLEELKQDPTDSQVPAEEVKTNPFDLSNLEGMRATTEQGGTTVKPKPDARQAAIDAAKLTASKFKVDMVSGQIAYIDGEMYRVGDTIGDSGFVLEAVDGLSCIIRTTDEHKLPFRLRYR